MPSFRHPLLSTLLVIIQFSTLALLFFVSSWQVSIFGWALQALAIALGVSALISIHLKHLSIFPDPLPNIQLVTHGPYRWIRHPMYASLLLFFLPNAVAGANASNLLIVSIYALLTITLILKLHYEETLLKERLPHYKEYQQQTQKLIPFLF